MQSVSSRIWTRVAVSISYDDNDYTTGTSKPQNIHAFSSTRDLVVVNKKKKIWRIVDFAVQTNH